MLQAAQMMRAEKGKGGVATVSPIPAPTGGLNAKDGFTEMGPSDAIQLDNWFPEAQYIVTRGGSLLWAAGMGAPVHTILTWQSPSGSDKMFAASGTSFWTVTASTSAATAAVTGLTNSNWQWTNIATSSTTTYLVACNGADSVRNYDGTTWTTPAITGVTSSTLINVVLHKLRLWFAQSNTLSLWYLPTQAIAGAATEFPIGAYARKGGYVMAVGTFSQDSGDGPDDYLVAITSNGQAVMFEGIDPSSATTWGLVGVFDIGKPVGRRCIGRLNGDMTIITSDGVISMRAMLQYGREADQKAAITAKIQTLFSQASYDYSGYFGWQILVYPKSRYCIVNYPVVADSQQKQFVMNTVTGAWCTFSNLNAGCWGTSNDKLFYGGNDGCVYQADTGNYDEMLGNIYFTNNSGGRLVFQNNSGGVIQFTGATVQSDINCTLRTAWRNFDIPQKKMITSFKPIMLTSGGVDYQHRVNWDFDDTPPSNTVVSAPVSGAIWGASSMVWPWTWGGQNVIDARWHGGGGLGTWASINFKVAVNGTSARINAFSVLLQQAGVF